MPKPGTLEFGRLFINFKVVFPDAPLSQSVRARLLELLPKDSRFTNAARLSKSGKTPFVELISLLLHPLSFLSHFNTSKLALLGGEHEYEEVYSLEQVDPNTFGHMDYDERSAYDSDDEDQAHAPPQCRQM